MNKNVNGIKLGDIGEVIGSVKLAIRNFSRSSEYSLSEAFKKSLVAAFPDYTFYFYERSVRVGTRNGQSIYVSNQSFAISEYLMDFCEEIGKYRSIAREVLNSNQEHFRILIKQNGSLEEDVFTALRDHKSEEMKNEFARCAQVLFREKYQQSPEEAIANTDKLVRFVTDYQWWLGGKQISRGNDWAISPISTLLNMPQNDSNFIARAVSRATEDAEYRNAFKHATEREWITSASETGKQELVFKTNISTVFARNRILFGAPGTGKSYTLNQEAVDLLGEGNEYDYERVTFHPDYSYANFVGTYKPVMVELPTLSSADQQTQYVITVLNDEEKSAQDKYDLLFETFKNEGLTRLPILLGIYCDELFKTRKADGTDAVDNNSVERNHGKAIRKYVARLTGKERSGEISYEYVPGPFMRLYVKALKNARSGNPRPFLLIIEEINRANVAAVFGDVFQLLDRDEDGVSEYPIQASEDIKKYLAKELGGRPEDYTKLRIPNNMFIWATMNSADQGVFPMDTAFKRRWDFSYLGIDDNDEKIRGKFVILGNKTYRHRVEWNHLRKAINSFLCDKGINEDKQLGPYFISRRIICPSGTDEIDRDEFIATFKNKVLMYLFEDAARQKRPSLFSDNSVRNMNRYSDICKEFDDVGVFVFCRDIVNNCGYVEINEDGSDKNAGSDTETVE